LSGTISTLQDQTLFQPVVYDARGNGDGKIVPTITGDHENRITDYTAIAIERKTFNEQSFSSYKESGKCSTLKAKAGNIGNGSESLVVEKISIAVDGYNGAVTGEKTASLTCKNDGSHSGPLVAEKAIRWIVRRLTPVECERLQGFPAGYTDIGDWTDSKGKKHKYADSPRYKALGNSIALPQWFWLVQKMRPYLKEKPTLGSLFDGLGGFPLVWQRAYGEGTARWASEIEEFPMAVTKRRFGEE
jgi:DNA (cytosine-5)-methyltransferase 1